MSYRLETDNIHFENKVPRSVFVKQVNYDLFFQLIYNLINNAIRYNKSNGSISVSGAQEPGKAFILQIADTGIGIRKDDLSGIFNRFKKFGRQNNEGYGLGLSIVKTITTFLGFHIEVASEPGEGTVFSLVIPGELASNKQ